MFKYKQNDRGFTILEVIVALVIVGISITAFVRLLGDSSMLRSRVDDYDNRLEVAVIKTEQVFLGLLDSSLSHDDGKNVLEGRIADRDINWRIEDKGFSGEQDGGVRFYTVSVDGIELSSAGYR